MKYIAVACLLLGSLGILFSCSPKIYSSNGESIYRTGRNLNGEMMLDKKHSSLTIVKSCQTCHGPDGSRMRSKPVSFSRLTDTSSYFVPYSDSLIARFIDHDLKSNGIKANIGVRWKMSDQDKKDLIAFLKTL